MENKGAEHFRYFENRQCEYYPCHDIGHINCLFCFCPLYTMEDCGGNYSMCTGENGAKIKDCSACILPHMPKGYDYITEKLRNLPV